MTLPVEGMQSKLKEFFKIENDDTDLKDAAILDYYTAAVWWASQQNYTAQQISAFFTVMYTLLEKIKDKNMSMVENLREFKKMMVGIGLDDVKDGSIDCFNVTQASKISHYAFTSLFQHYKLYQYMFTKTQAEEIIGTDLQIEVAKAAEVPFPPPLDEGVTEEIYNLYIATPPPTPIPERVGKMLETTVESSTSPQISPSTISTPKQTSPTPKPVEEPPDPSKVLDQSLTESEMLSKLTPQDVKEVIESVVKEILEGLQGEVVAKLRDKENQIIQRINKIHKVAEA
ncbi:hypothetical protein CHS0354_036428 [Potamilus streckersoni]|uniref:Ciliary associated calcium binding coiled-coil 1 n=1 Tax=Potamilus streckersoni TaxID=2493646 RepID=A0AAE0SWL2_9BIVA|nr:hypothetical protein CHS0354_036428 [Potamilus streckersoni]